VFGDRDQLIQVFLNLVKNACEVPGDGEREIELSTAYKHGLRLAVPGQQARVNLPLVVSVRDNGRGVSDELRAHLFDAFVTNKPTGTGLGLALSPRSSTTTAARSSTRASRAAPSSGSCCRCNRRPTHEYQYHHPQSPTTIARSVPSCTRRWAGRVTPYAAPAPAATLWQWVQKARGSWSSPTW
jgi:K+-sensing histidine kinase KdpD